MTAASADRAQRPDDHAGSVIRLHDDGRVPKDIPSPARRIGKRKSTRLGNRNCRRCAASQTGLLWTHEHGPQGGDEINVIGQGQIMAGRSSLMAWKYGIGTKIGEGTHKAGMTQPLHFWVPSIAPSGMAFHTGDKFPRCAATSSSGPCATRYWYG